MLNKRITSKYYKQILILLRDNMKDLFNVEGKVALVTGGSRGIGAMIAEGFVKNGVKTYITSCLLYTSPSPRDQRGARMPSSA